MGHSSVCVCRDLNELLASEIWNKSFEPTNSRHINSDDVCVNFLENASIEYMNSVADLNSYLDQNGISIDKNDENDFGWYWYILLGYLFMRNHNKALSVAKELDTKSRDIETELNSQSQNLKDELNSQAQNFQQELDKKANVLDVEKQMAEKADVDHGHDINLTVNMGNLKHTLIRVCVCVCVSCCRRNYGPKFNFK